MAVRQYIGARYVTKIYENSLDPSSAEWEAGVTYEPLTMVTYLNSSYLSKKEVPGSVGDPSANPSYWVVTGAYNGQIMQLQNDVSALQSAITGLVSTPEDYGAVGNGLTDDTAAVNSCFQDPNTILVVGKPGSVYLVDGDISIKTISNKIIDLNGATIKTKPTTSTRFYTIDLNGVDNVTIKNGTIIGDRDTHLGTTGEWGYGIHVEGDSSNITLDNLVVTKCWGDSICIDHCSNVNITNCELSYSRRQGLTIGACVDVIVDGNYIHHISGTAPESGIDIEPIPNTDAINVIIANNIVKDCNSAFFAAGDLSENNLINISVQSNKFMCDGSTATIVGLTANGLIFHNNEIRGNSTGKGLIIAGDKMSIKGNYIAVNPVDVAIVFTGFTNSVFSDNDIVNCAGFHILNVQDAQYSIIENNNFKGGTSSSVYLYFRSPSGHASDNKIMNNVFDNVTGAYFTGFAVNAGNNVFAHNVIDGTYQYVTYGVENNSGDNLYFNVITDGTSGTHTGNSVGTRVENIVNGTLVP